jgi:putative transposase
MAWRLKKVEEQRQALVEAYFKGTDKMVELCEQFGISRKTAYKWCNRYRSFAAEGLKDRSKAPHQPYSIFNEDTINMAIDLKVKHPKWGPKKVRARLSRDYPRMRWPSATRLYEIFKGHHLVTPRRLRARVPATHPLGDLNNSNDVWIADFKGWFLTRDSKKCEPLTITDGFSRFLIKCRHLFGTSTGYVWPIFMEAFQEYGLPNRIRTDNGPPFGSIGVGRLTPLSINFIKAGIVPEWINPGHPEENGRHERFHLTLKDATANPPAETLMEQINRMAAFQEEYNYERPHESLNMDTPSDHYCTSKRKWDGKLRAPEYDTQVMIVRKVGQNGCIWIKQTEYYVGHTLTGEYVGVKANEEGEFAVHYGPVYLGKLKDGCNRMERPKLKRKKVVRR